ncbi:MAG: hypothetical protein RML33_01255 [Acidobacteriota bacterium]|nr:hypothetical protein [Acidobacteriota bacterium]
MKLRNFFPSHQELDDRLFPTVKKELPELEQEKRIFLEFDLEEMRLSIFKKSKEKFEAKIGV